MTAFRQEWVSPRIPKTGAASAKFSTDYCKNTSKSACQAIFDATPTKQGRYGWLTYPLQPAILLIERKKKSLERQPSTLLHNSFVCNILPVTPIDSRFYPHLNG
jgi:hypothetical protein